MIDKVGFHERCKDDTVRRGIAFLLDPLADAREHCADNQYPFALGSAKSQIGSLLDALGYPQHGPDLFDVEWYATHPVEYDEVDQ